MAFDSPPLILRLDFDWRGNYPHLKATVYRKGLYIGGRYYSYKTIAELKGMEFEKADLTSLEGFRDVIPGFNLLVSPQRSDLDENFIREAT